MRIKYPRTPHLPFSPGATKDDRILEHLDCFEQQEIVITEKMDGENITMYSDGWHARSIDSRFHPSRTWLANLHGNISYLIPTNYRICGEYLYARHSIEYDNLPSYFMVFSVWDENNNALSWDDTVKFCHELQLETVPVLWRGKFNEKILKQIAQKLDTSKHEGFVVRVTSTFKFTDFQRCVAKWVRPNHVQTDEHWMHSKVITNKMRTNNC